MPASEAQIRANQENARKSTGPTTPEGKERSRANAVKHGLCSEVVGVEDPGAIRDRAEGLTDSMPPAHTLAAWLAGQIATISMQIERAQAMQQSVLERISVRAELFWDDDRRLDANLLGDDLPALPSLIVEQLRQTFHGCEWLMTRWAMLAHASAQPGGWTLPQKALAFDLLGTPAEFRQGNEPGLSIDLDGHPTGPIEDQATLARTQIAELKRRCERTGQLDEIDRRRAEEGLADDAELKRLRRYEADLHRRLRWMVQMLQGPAAPTPPTNPPPPPKPNPETNPTPADPETSPNPGPSPLPPRSADRAEKKLRKAEARREARLRKLDQRRA